MEKWPWWAWVAIGLVGGSAITAALLEWTRVDHAAIWTVGLAMQGWFGAVLGAAGAFGAAVFVLFAQRRLDDVRFEKAQDAERRRSEDQHVEVTRQMAADRELAREERAVAAWAVLSSRLQQLAFVDSTKGPSGRRASISEAWVLWSLHLRTQDDRFAEDIRALCSEALRRFEDRGKDGKSIAELVGKIAGCGVAWHRNDGARGGAEVLTRRLVDEETDLAASARRVMPPPARGRASDP